MKLLVLPRDPNPYQGLLYSEMQRLGARITYIGELTRSQTLNLLLLPLEVAAWRAVGARLVHLHWVFTFVLPGTERFPAMRKLAYIWFLTWLRVCQLLGVRLVWTAHNVVPHRPVFQDDVAARCALVSVSELVLAHSSSTLTELAAFGAVPRRSVVIEHGPISPMRPAPDSNLSRPAGAARRFLFFGRVEEYKGVDDLMAAFEGMPAGVPAHLTLAGHCDVSELRARLEVLGQADNRRITLRLERIPDDEVDALLAAADVVVLPYRRVTTSGTAMLALSHGRPLVVPTLPGLADLPDQAVIRYDGKVSSLTRVLVRMACADDEILAAMSAAARTYTAGMSWQDIARRTMVQMTSLLAGGEPGQCGQPARAP
jgi:glycosyltransferase involved in cell wall biosynthesis